MLVGLPLLLAWDTACLFMFAIWRLDMPNVFDEVFSFRFFVLALNTSGALVPVFYSSGSTKSFKTKAWKLQHPSLVFF